MVKEVVSEGEKEGSKSVYMCVCVWGGGGGGGLWGWEWGGMEIAERWGETAMLRSSSNGGRQRKDRERKTGEEREVKRE